MFCPRLDSTLVASIYCDIGDFAACIPVLSALASAAAPEADDDIDYSIAFGGTSNLTPRTTSPSAGQTVSDGHVSSDKNILIWSEEVADASATQPKPATSSRSSSGLYKQGQIVNTSSYRQPVPSQNRTAGDSRVASSSSSTTTRAIKVARNPNYKPSYMLEELVDPEPIDDLENDQEEQQQPLTAKKKRQQKKAAAKEKKAAALTNSATSGLQGSDKTWNETETWDEDEVDVDTLNRIKELMVSNDAHHADSKEQWSSNDHTSGDDDDLGVWETAPTWDAHDYIAGGNDDAVFAEEVEFLRNCFPDRGYSDEYLTQILVEGEGDPEMALDIILSQIFLESEQVETSSTGSGSMHSSGSQGTTSTTTGSSLDDAFFQGVPKNGKKSKAKGNRNSGSGIDDGSAWGRRLNQLRDTDNDVLLKVIDGQVEFLIPESNDWATFDHQVSILMNIFPTVTQKTIISEFHANDTHLFRTVDSLEKRLERENHYNSTDGRERLRQFDSSLAQLIEIFPSHSAAGLKRILVFNGGNVQDAMNAVLAADYARADQTERRVSSSKPGPASKRRVMIPIQADIRYSDKSHGALPSTSNPGASRPFSNTILDKSNAELYNDHDDPSSCRDRAQELLGQRNEMYRKAAQAYRQTKGKGLGMSGIAAYYAEEGKKLDNEGKQWNMRAARAVVQQQRIGNRDENVVDLHGLTVSEAQTVVQETVTQWYARSTMQASRAALKPLKIICGVGSHSKDKIARLYPSVLSLLVKDGWRCEAGNGVIIVKGANPPSSTPSQVRKW
ncbi:hypothetical protein BGX31_005762 [Mortierella sp. GBA43]|nr:hypothetical protein BGX31_005762 [Mortierella sp. GBA43]